MPEKRNNVYKKRMISMIAVTVAFVLSLLAYGQLAFGWFSSSQKVETDGMGVHSQEYKNLQIRATSDGADISVGSIRADMGVINNVVSGDTTGSGTQHLFPGASGSFTFYVHDGSTGTQAPYSFEYRISAKNDKFNTKSQNEGFKSNVTEKQRETALQYLSSHILFFKKNEDGLYWIHPGEFETENVSGGQTPAPREVTVYWVWVEHYKYIFQENDGLFDEETRTEIKEYYLDPQNTDKIMARGENSVEAFNEADTIIGITLQYICFEIEVSSR